MYFACKSSLVLTSDNCELVGEGDTRRSSNLILSIIKNPAQFRSKQISLLNLCSVHLFTFETNTDLHLAAIYFDLKDSLCANSEGVKYRMNSSPALIFDTC